MSSCSFNNKMQTFIEPQSFHEIIPEPTAPEQVQIHDTAMLTLLYVGNVFFSISAYLSIFCTVVSIPF